MENGKVFWIIVPPRYSYSQLVWLYIDKRSCYNKWDPVSQGGTISYMTFSTWGRGDKGEKILKYFNTDLFTLIIYNLLLLNNTAIPCSFLPFLVEKYELYFIYVKWPLMHPNLLCWMNCSIHWYHVWLRTILIFSENGDCNCNNMGHRCGCSLLWIVNFSWL